MIPGSEVAHLPQENRQSAAEAVGDFLRVLHQLEVEVPLPDDPNGRATPSRRAEGTRRALARLTELGVWGGSATVDALIEVGLPAPAGPGVLVHGDLHLRHLLVDVRGRATGVIDWGDTCFADPAVDLSLAYAAFAGPSRQAMLTAYGPVSAEREVRARALALSLCAALAEWAAAVGETALLAEFLQGVHRAIT